MSALGLMEACAERGIESCAVADPAGTHAVKEQLRQATHGRVDFSPMYWMNQRTRSAAWKRPLIELRQGLRTGWAYVSSARAMHRASQWNVDLVHTCNIMIPEGAATAAALGLPHVWHLRELVGPGEPFRLRREGRALGRYLERWASRVIANSEVAASKIRPHLRAELLEVVPNGIAIGRFSGIGMRNSAGPVTFGLVGSPMARVKNHGLFIEAASRVVRRYSGHRPLDFAVFGELPAARNAYVEGLRRRAEALGLGARFRFAGYDPDPASIMTQIDVLVHPTAHESFGRVVVEAMASGRPTVVARGGGVAEIVEDEVTGLLAAPDDPDDFCRQMVRLLDAPEWAQRLGEAGRRRAEERYSLEACAEGVIRVYEEAMHHPLGAWGTRNA